MSNARSPRRVLFVFGWLIVGGEETEARLLARHLDPTRYTTEVVACVYKPNMPDQTHQQLEALGVRVDRTPYGLVLEEKSAYLADKVTGYDLVVSFQGMPQIVPALERAARRPPLIEHGGVVVDASTTPKHLTTRYVGVCAAIREAAAALMPERPHHALEIPSMVDLTEFDAAERGRVRSEWGVPEDVPVIGWVTRLDRRKRVEDFIRAAALVRDSHPEGRFVVIGGPDPFMPDYTDELRALTRELGLEDVLTFLGDRPDVPRLLAGLDVFVLLSRDEGMTHVITEAGAAGLPVVATRDNGAVQQITDGVSGLFVPHEAPAAAAAALKRLIEDPSLRQRLGSTLRRKVEREYSTEVVIPQWEALFAEVLAEANP
ncbi:MAG: glycosyltransferase family 4 protein [Pseudomonadota bacterium]|nr:glycosyltransferase family 4 protein [Pseudomonadota bacterium]